MPDSPAIDTVKARTPPVRHRPVWVTALVAGLLALYGVIAVGSKLHKGPSFDEPEELAMGYNIWTNGDFRMEGANGDFVKRWATLPYLWMKPKYVSRDNPYWLKGDPYSLGWLFFFQSGNAPEELLLTGRMMMALVAVATGLLVFICAQELSGTLGGLAALLLFTFSPNMLCFGAMVSTEMPTCLALLGSTWCIWKLLHEVTWPRLADSLAFFLLLALSKPSALVIFPLTVVMIGIKLATGLPLDWQIVWPGKISSRMKQVGVFLGLALLHGLAAWSAIWAQYDFRFQATPPDAAPAVVRADQLKMGNDSANPLAAAFMAWATETHFLPKGFIVGAQHLLVHDEERDAFLDGKWKTGGWPSFFLYASWEKTSPTLFLLFLIGVGSWGWSSLARSVPPARKRPVKDYAGLLYMATPYIALPVVFFAIAETQDLNIGQRHVLPAYPAIYILGGVALAWTWDHRGKWIKLLIASLMLLRVAEAILIYPDYLAYFNPLVGGSAKGYQHLVDSSLDWGMDLPELKDWLDLHNPKNKKTVYLAYFGTDEPNYQGIQCLRLPSDPDWTARGRYPIGPGIYAISATLFQTVYTKTFGPWNKFFEQQYQIDLQKLQLLESTKNHPAARTVLLAKYPGAYWAKIYDTFEKLRFARLCAWLRHHETPDTSAGYSILIWDLDDDEMRAALLGPPAELAEKPLQPEMWQLSKQL